MLIKRFNLFRGYFRGYIVWISENTSFFKILSMSVISDIDCIFHYNGH